MTKAEYEEFLKDLKVRKLKAKMELMTNIKNFVDEIVDREFDLLKKEIEKNVEK